MLDAGSVAHKHHKLWYNLCMPITYRFNTKLTPEEQKLADCAKEASRKAVQAAFAAGLSITIGRDGKLIRVDPDGTETIIGEY